MNPPTSVPPVTSPTSIPNGPLARYLRDPGGTVNSVLDAVVHAVLRFLTTVGPPTAAIVIVSLIAWWLLSRWRAQQATENTELMEILPPPVVDKNSAEAFWSNIHGLLVTSTWRRLVRGPLQVSFETLMAGERVRFGLWVPRSAADHVCRAASAAWPGATVVRAEAGSWLPSGSSAAVTELRLGRGQWLPIATDHALDPLRAVLGAGAELSADETALVQVTARPAARARLSKAWQGLLGAQGVPTSGSGMRLIGSILHPILDLLTPGPSPSSRPAPRPTSVTHPYSTEGREKLARSCFEGVVRLGVIGPAADRRMRRQLRARVRAIAAAFGPYGGHNSLVARRLARPAESLAGHRFRRGDVYSVPEIAALAHLPLDRDVPGLTRAGARRVSPPPGIPRSGKILGSADTSPGRPVAIDPVDASQHLHLLGATGSGKSTLMLNLVLDDIAERRGTVVLDPKGDLVNDVLDRLPADAADRVVVIDPEDPDPPALNVIGGKDVHLAVDQVVGVMHRLFESAWGPRTDDVLRAALLTIRQREGSNLTQVPKLLTDPIYRAPLVATVGDPVLRGFWRWYDGLSEAGRSAVIGPLTNKLRAFLLRPFVRAVVGSGTSSFLLDQVLDGGALLCRLPKGVLGDETVRLMGSLLVGQVWQAAAARGRRGRMRPGSALYLDECQNFLALPGSLEDILAEARAYGLGLVLAHQHLGQLPSDLADAVSANARSKVFLSTSPEDARRLERHVAPELTAHDLCHLGAYQAAARLVVNGEETSAFTLRTRPAPPAIDGRARLVREHSRRRHGLSEDSRRAAALVAEGSRGGRSSDGPPDDAPDGLELPGLSRVERAGGAAN